MQAQIKIGDCTYSRDQFFALEKLPIESLKISSVIVTGDINNPQRIKVDNHFIDHFENSCCKTQQGFIQPPINLADVHFQNCQLDIDFGLERFTANAFSLNIVSCNLTEDQLSNLNYQLNPYILGSLNLSKNMLGKNPEKLKKIFRQFHESEFRFTANLSENYVDSNLIEQLRLTCPGLSFIQ